MEYMLQFWNAGLTLVLGIMGYFIKEKFNDLDRISILINKTREEIARD